jgi:hypothetical protein
VTLTLTLITIAGILSIVVLSYCAVIVQIGRKP